MTNDTQDELNVDMDEAAMIAELENVANETKNEAFLRLVNKRLPVAVKRIRLLKNLASGNYEYTDAQAGQVVAIIRTELEELERAFFSTHEEDSIPTIE